MAVPVPVAYITHYPELYGANRSLLDLMLELRDRGAVRPHVLLPREGDLVAALQREGIAHAVVPFRAWMSERHYSGRLHHRIRQYWQQERQARERAAANRAILPALIERVHRWQVRLLHANSAVVGVAPALKAATGLPLVWHIRELPERQYLLHLDAGTRAYGRALRRADRIIAISQAVREDILRYTGPGARITVVYNGVLRAARYAELAAGNEARWSTTPPFTFLLVGLIHPSKGQVEAVEALALLKRQGHPVRLVIAGDGRESALRQRIAELGVDDVVELKGFVKDPFPLFRGAHALLMCSRNEAMGRVTVEGMACGLPVVGHASGGTLELVNDGVNGLLYPGGAEALAERMARLATDAGLARRLGAEAARTAAGRFSVERYAGEVNEVYRAVLSDAH
ncbi:MAG TPA: glycosyltransferase [Flavobacteriales bacterium]|nr:glycosyltransferase [Flavobacteriales bacterium]HMR27759.1 glycosyltransferase [Flavobacteriales bacterium]